MVQPENFAIIVAAGKGLRMGSETKKQYLCLSGMPVLSRTIKAFDASEFVHEIVVVIPKEDRAYCRKNIIDPFGFAKKIHLISGGNHRQESVLNGLMTIRDRVNQNNNNIVLIHDGVRPFVDPGIIETCIKMAIEYGACLPAIKMTDTIKEVHQDFYIKKTVERDFLYHAQTPQVFRLDLILSAFEHALEKGFSGTDDASLVEYFGHKVVITKGSGANIKITTPEDLVFGNALLESVKNK